MGDRPSKLRSPDLAIGPTDVDAGSAGPVREAPDTALARPGRYRVRSTLGRGGQSRVYLAHDTLLGRDVALKQPLFQRREDSAPLIARFLREAEITARLEHPNIVPVYDIGRGTDGAYFCAQKLIGTPDRPPRTLRSALKEAGGLDERLALLPHVLAVCHAVAYAHERHVIHRDLKPDNVVVGRLGETVVLDWGLAKVIGEADAAVGDSPTEQSPVETVAGVAVGTPAYMSPEQAAGRVDEVGTRSDVWSLGAMLYEILAGRPPHLAPTGRATVEHVLHAHPQPVRSRCPEAPPELAAVAEKAIARDPADRYASATELAADLEAFQEHARVGVYRYSAFELVRLFVRRHRALVAVAAVAAVLVASAAVVATLQYRQASRYLGEARASLAHALVEKGRRAQAHLQWHQAAAYFAAARTNADLPQARWGARLAESRLHAPITRFAAHEPGSSIHSLAFTREGILVSAADDGAIKFWDLDGGRQAAVIDTEATIFAAAVSPDGAWIATGSEQGQLALWNAASGERVETVYEHGADVLDVAFSENGRRIAAGTGDYHVLVYDLDETRLIADVTVDGVPIYGVAFEPDGELLAAGWDGWIRHIDVDTAELIREWEAHADAALALAVAPDSERVVTGGRDALVKLWRPDYPGASTRLTGHSHKVYAAAFSPDGTLLATGDGLDTLRMWDVASGRPLPSRSIAHGEGVGAIAFSPDGRHLAWAGASTIWVRTRQALPSPVDGQRWATRVALSPDTGLRVHGRPSGNVTVTDAASGELLREIEAHEEDAYAVAFSPDGETLATGGYEGTAALWDVSSWDERVRLRGHERGITRIAFSPDGRLVATASWDQTVRLWRVDSGEPVAELVGHGDQVRGVAFFPDGETLVSGARDGTLRFWDVANGEELGVYEVDERALEDVRVACDGDCVVYRGRRRHVVELPPEVAPERQLERILQKAELAPEGIDFVREPAARLRR